LTIRLIEQSGGRSVPRSKLLNKLLGVGLLPLSA
jgi:hypothetical protein